MLELNRDFKYGREGKLWGNSHHLVIKTNNCIEIGESEGMEKNIENGERSIFYKSLERLV